MTFAVYLNDSRVSNSVELTSKYDGKFWRIDLQHHPG